MSCYWVYGTLGAGKGIFFAKKMKEYLARGSRVATNMEVFPEKLSPNTTASITRLPDLPRLEDLKSLGRGCPEGEKTKLGGLFLDETAIWLNSRSWNEKGRGDMIAYFRLLRKMGWDIYFAIQDPESADKQALGATGENFICCSRLDHFRIPAFSDLYDFYRIVKSKGKEQSSKILPHINRAAYRRGKKTLGNKPFQSETYFPKDFFGTYDTNQLFEADIEHLNGRDVDMRAPYSYLPGLTLRKYEYIRKQLELESKKEDEMDISLDDIELEKPKPKFPKWSFIFFLIFSALAIGMWSIILSSPDAVAQEPGQPTTQTEQTQQVEPKLPPVPDYLQGVYISGYFVMHKNGKVTYDYALHDKFHRSFDYSHYALTVTPAAPCVAWLTTIENQSFRIGCSMAPPSQSKPSVNNSLLANFELSDVAQQTYEAL
ncbi:TPA: hypothetical protein NKB37_000641 [Vibrio parahaemolyticus]|nr:hypothetical protein [Vibrio parahaemolyticus]